MLEVLPHLPSNVLGIQARGEVTADDYRSVLVPAVEEKLSRHEDLRLLYILGADFNGYTGRAAWEDAKVGMRHFTDFERIAVVTSEDWIARTVKAVGFIAPGEVRVFANEDIDAARAWISEPSASSSRELEFELLEDSGVLVLEPDGELESSDFERIAQQVDPYIEKAGDLDGLVIVADEFPGWENFTAFTTHLRFLRDHQAKIHRVGVVTDSHFLSNAPKVAGSLLEAEVKHFPSTERRAAIHWAATGA
jgi:hypothetical protein